MKTFRWMIPLLAGSLLGACSGGAGSGGEASSPTNPPPAPTEETSFREFALATIEADPDSEPVDLEGRVWTDMAEDDPMAFDSVLSGVAQ